MIFAKQHLKEDHRAAVYVCLLIECLQGIQLRCHIYTNCDEY